MQCFTIAGELILSLINGKSVNVDLTDGVSALRFASLQAAQLQLETASMSSPENVLLTDVNQPLHSSRGSSVISPESVLVWRIGALLLIVPTGEISL